MAPKRGAYINNNRIRPCCWFDRKGVTNKIDNLIDVINVFHSEEMDDIRASEPEACWKCRMHEEKGGKSHRDLWNSRYEDDGEVRLEMLDIYLGNLCNIACVMCSSNNSTKWIQEEKKLFGSAFRSYQEDIDLTVNYDMMKDVKRIKLAGGEPLIIPGVITLMQQLIDMDLAKNIKLSIITNNTVSIANFEKYLKHFRAIELILSVEGINEVNDYVRYGSFWDNVSRNIMECRDLGYELSINCVVSILNVYHLPRLIDWWDGEILFRILDYPSHLSINVMNEHERKVTLDNLKGYPELDHICKVLQDPQSNDREKFEEWITKLDNNRGNSFWSINEQFNTGKE